MSLKEASEVERVLEILTGLEKPENLDKSWEVENLSSFFFQISRLI
jgi:hypothetical protein